MNKKHPPCSTRAVLTLLLALCSFSATAQRPNWVPIAELVVSSLGHADAQIMSEVMNRCTALNMALSGMLLAESPDLSDDYQNQALRMIQSSILISINSEKEATGLEPDLEIVSDIAVTDVKEMFNDYNLWLSDNFDLNGSLFDSEFETELKGCELAFKLVSSVLIE